MTGTEQAKALFFEGLEHHNRHRFLAAETCYRRALDLVPERVSVLVNLSAVLIAQSKFDEAAALCRRVLAIEPGNTECRAHLDVCRHAGATTRQRWLQLEQAVVAHPDDAGAHDRLGRAWLDNGDPRRALACFETALRLSPGDTSAGVHRAQTLLALGRADDALRAYLDCLATAPGSLVIAQAALAVLLEHGHAMAWTLHDPRVVRLLIEGLATPLLIPQLLAPLAMARVLLDLQQGGPQQVSLDALADMPVLMRVLVHARIATPELESLLTDVRCRLLAQLAAVDGVGALDPVVRLAVAIATQCWRNEYCWYETEAETAQVHVLATRIRGGDAMPFDVLALAMYAPLDTVLGDDRERPAAAWPDALTRLVSQQLALDAQARSAAASVPQLTAIDDATAARVRQWDDHAPSPRWTALPAQAARTPLAQFARQAIAGAPELGITPGPGGVRALNAGCGTGQHAVDMALRIDGLHLLAIDPSRARLGYAMALARRHDVHGIEFAQADLSRLRTLDRQFDYIESADALQHLEAPEAGLAALVDCLAPRGLVRIALHSRRGRQCIRHCRDWTSAQEPSQTIASIRALRQAILALPPGDPRREVTRFSDFYATGECRDLLLRTGEPHYDLVEVHAMLERQGVRPLGLEAPDAMQQAFVRTMPGARLDDFSAWDRFEAAHPRTFERMFFVWAQKPG
ncbi:class I SAM-dependent methyltransferase [Luteimonas deserti]|uniref:Tetratricopeptide repeat protein n=1 Tax=Luteimonas deserti TaxID=2752306 RepID=A0A7Z0QP88_9GAMM|nr:class I SAM-dependent methyltransferase [Luteimonas deserti]NYZ61337.1 tetratricopeptide repeat protein [Luteimonas deserti]